jgi:methylmalonyl-CoA/ethylmalonyl-CoA epimerase
MIFMFGLRTQIYLKRLKGIVVFSEGFVKFLKSKDNSNHLNVMEKVEHIGIAVRSLAEAIPKYEQLLGTPCYKTEEVASEQVRTAFFRQGETKIELLESMSPDGVIAQFIEKRGEGLHHIAFAVTDIRAEMEKKKADGFQLLNAEPKAGADNKLVCFIHPKTTGGVLVELCQERG